MPVIDNRIIEAMRRQQQITEYLVYPFSNITDYQIKLTGVPSFSKEDILIISNKKILSHWVESKGTVWTKIPELVKNTPLKIYILTGNPSATSVSSGKNTFVQYRGAATTNYQDTNVIKIPFIWEGKVRRTSATGWFFIGVSNQQIMYPGSGDDSVSISHQSPEQLYGVSHNNGVESYFAAGAPFWTINTYYRIKIEAIASNNVKYYVRDLVSSQTITTNNPDALMGLNLYLYSGSNAEQEFSFIRKYVSPEPIIRKVRTLNKSFLIKELGMR